MIFTGALLGIVLIQQMTALSEASHYARRLKEQENLDEKWRATLEKVSKSLVVVTGTLEEKGQTSLWKIPEFFTLTETHSQVKYMWQLGCFVSPSGVVLTPLRTSDCAIPTSGTIHGYDVKGDYFATSYSLLEAKPEWNLALLAPASPLRTKIQHTSPSKYDYWEYASGDEIAVPYFQQLSRDIAFFKAWGMDQKQTRLFLCRTRILCYAGENTFCLEECLPSRAIGAPIVSDDGTLIGLVQSVPLPGSAPSSYATVGASISAEWLEDVLRRNPHLAP
jgi:hypothetical protein